MDRRYHLKNIRTLLTEGFDDEKLRRLCYDVPDFRPVYDQLARNSGKAEIIDRLLEYADRTLQIETLLSLVKEHNPARFEKHQPYETIDLTVDSNIDDREREYSRTQPVVITERNEPQTSKEELPRTSGEEVKPESSPIQDFFSHYTFEVWVFSFTISVLLNAIAYFFLLSFGIDFTLCLTLVSTLISTILLTPAIPTISNQISNLKSTQPKIDLPSVSELILIEDPFEIEDHQEQFIRGFDNFSSKPIPVRINILGKNRDIKVLWFKQLRIWAYLDNNRIQEIDQGHQKILWIEYWNTFGVGEPEINTSPPYCHIKFGSELIMIGSKEEITANYFAGGFAKDETNRVFVIHRGHIALDEGRGSMKQKDFKKKYLDGHGKWVDVKYGPDKMKIDHVLIIGQLGSPNLAKSVAQFVKEVEKVKNPQRRFWHWLR